MNEWLTNWHKKQYNGKQIKMSLILTYDFLEYLPLILNFHQDQTHFNTC